MAIDRTGISSLDTGASDITYTGDEGPQDPRAMTDIDKIILQHWLQQGGSYGDDIPEEFKLEIIKMYGLDKMASAPDMAEGIQTASSVADMATGGRAGYANGQRVGFRVGKGAGMEKTSDTGMPDFGLPDSGPKPGDHHPPVIKPPVIRPKGDGPPSVLNPLPVIPKGRTTNDGIRDSRMDRWKKHAQFTNYLKYRNAKNYHQTGGLDFKTRFSSIPNWAAKGLGYGYQGVTEGLRGLGKYLTGDPGAMSDAYSRALEEGRLNALGIEQFGTGSPLEQKYLAERKFYETLANGGLAGLYRYGGFSG